MSSDKVVEKEPAVKMVNHIAKLNVNIEELLIEKLEMKAQIRALQQQIIDGELATRNRSL